MVVARPLSDVPTAPRPSAVHTRGSKMNAREQVAVDNFARLIGSRVKVLRKVKNSRTGKTSFAIFLTDSDGQNEEGPIGIALSGDDTASQYEVLEPDDE